MSKRAKSSTKRVRRREFCLDCGLNEAEVGGGLSVQGYCPACGRARMIAAITAMKTKRGSGWERWKRSQQAYLDSLKK